ncbi:MAG: serine--tRNA ligase [Acetobacteraceae bacterium]|nr:serine--tRNA ligase [Acetobacteraceae bacterium]
MHDIRAIRDNPDAFDAALARRGLASVSAEILRLDGERRLHVGVIQAHQTAHNEASKNIGVLMRAGKKEEADRQRADLATALDEVSKQALAEIEARIKEILESLPNNLDAAVPCGHDESANVVLATHGAPRDLGYPARQHFELGEALGMMDFAAAAKLAGARFTVLRGPLARLERALGQFMLDLHTIEHGYEETIVPSLVNSATVYGTGNLPKFSEDLFQTTDGRWLIPTAEVPLTNMAADEILPEKKLPWRVTSLTDCYRSEAGAAGRDTRGMIRQHQFRKVEMVTIAAPWQSDAEHEHMTRSAEKVLALLELPYRRVLLSSGDTGFGAARTHDLEVWLPGQQAWREISSCSNCRDFQARRMNARYRPADGAPVAYVHTLNGSGVAVGRALVAVMENHQQADGSILIPAVLHPYMGGLERITAP